MTEKSDGLVLLDTKNVDQLLVAAQKDPTNVDAAFNIGMIVGVQRGQEFDGRFLLKPRDHLRPIVEESIDSGVVKEIAGSA